MASRSTLSISLSPIAAQQHKPLEEWLYADFVAALSQIHADLAPLPNNMIPNVAGSLLTTAPEYAQFMLRLLDPHDRIAQQMLVPQHKLNSILDWGLGIGLETVNGESCFWHWGRRAALRILCGETRPLAMASLY
jgi:hypothetical protein